MGTNTCTTVYFKYPLSRSKKYHPTRCPAKFPRARRYNQPFHRQSGILAEALAPPLIACLTKATPPEEHKAQKKIRERSGWGFY